MAHLGVDGVREIDGSGVHRQLDNLAPRREHEDLIGGQFAGEQFHRFPRILSVFQVFQQSAKPSHGCQLPFVRRRLVLVDEMRGDPHFRLAVHFAGADLNFKDIPGGSEYKGVEGLIAVGLGKRDVVLEPFRNGCVGGVHQAQRLVAVLGDVQDDSRGKQIVNLIQIGVQAAHLLPEGVQVLGTAQHLAVDPVGPEQRLQF